MTAHSAPQPELPWYRKPAVLGGGAAALLAVVVGIFAFGGGDDDSPTLTEDAAVEEAEDPTPTPLGLEGDIFPPAAPITSTVAMYPTFLTSTLTDLQPGLGPAGIGEPGPGWTITAEAPIEARSGGVAVWSGEEVLIWGGQRFFGTVLADGAAYNPETDTWRVLAESPLAGRSAAVGVWTGTEMLVIGGLDAVDLELTDAAAYDPIADTWRSLEFGLAITDYSGSAVLTDAGVFVTGAYLADDAEPPTDTFLFDSENGTFTDLPANPRFGSDVARRAMMTDAGLFVVQLEPEEDEAYLDWFDLDALGWVPNDPIPGLGAFDVDITSFAWTGTLFVVAGSYSDGATYDPVTGAVEPVPGSRSIVDWPAVMVDDHVFVGDTRFDPEQQLWIDDVSFPSPDPEFPMVVDIGNKAFIWGGTTCGRSNDCVEFVGVQQGFVWGEPFPGASRALPTLTCAEGDGTIVDYGELGSTPGFETVDEAVDQWWADADGESAGVRSSFEERFDPPTVTYGTSPEDTQVTLRLDLNIDRWHVVSASWCGG